MTDVLIVGSSFIAFCVFIGGHIFVFRHLDHTKAVPGFLATLLIVGFALIAVAGLLAALLYGLTACIYFMGIFGLLATSVRIRMLSEIARTGGRGMTYKELLTRYNRKEIVGGRLARLVSSGDIVYEGGKYRAGGRVTFFVFPAAILRAMKFLYG